MPGCEKLGVNKTKVTIKNSAEDHTKSIDCPLFLSSYEPRPLIIRIEEKCKKICGLLGYDPTCEGSYDIINTEYHPAQVDAEDIEFLVRKRGEVECNCVKESSYGCHANNGTCICKASFYGEKCDKGMNKN